MTRKRFVKLLMGYGYSRAEAEAAVKDVRGRTSYKRAFETISGTLWGRIPPRLKQAIAPAQVAEKAYVPEPYRGCPTPWTFLPPYPYGPYRYSVF